MKMTLKALCLFSMLSFTTVMHADLTLGSYDGPNCIPFMCNTSGTNVGLSYDYQEAYNSAKFSGSTSISSITWYLWPPSVSNVFLGGSYTFYWGYSAVGLNLTANLAANLSGSESLLGTWNVPAGGFPMGSSATFSSFIPFSYDPSAGDLLVEIVVYDQDNVPNTGLNGYNWSDTVGGNVARAWCAPTQGCNGNDVFGGALVTTFGTTPESGTIVLLGSGLLGAVGILRRKMNL
jgi:hypothetical protein